VSSLWEGKANFSNGLPTNTKLVLNNRIKCHHTIYSKVNLRNGGRNYSSILNLLPMNAHTLYHMHPNQKVQLRNSLTTVTQRQLTEQTQASYTHRYTVGKTGHSILTTVHSEVTLRTVLTWSALHSSAAFFDQRMYFLLSIYVHQRRFTK